MLTVAHGWGGGKKGQKHTDVICGLSHVYISFLFSSLVLY